MNAELKKFAKILVLKAPGLRHQLYISMAKGDTRGNAKLVGKRIILN